MVSESSVKTVKLESFVCRIKPLGRAEMRFALSSSIRKFFALKEKIASAWEGPLFMKLYSIAPTGRLELSSSVGIKGLQPVMVTPIGMSLSVRWMEAKGKVAVKAALVNRGRP